MYSVWKNRTLIALMSNENEFNGFSTRKIDQKTTSKSSEKHPSRNNGEFTLLTGGSKPRRANRDKELRGLIRVAAVTGRLLSVLGCSENGRQYRLLVDSGYSINRIKESYVPPQCKKYKLYKKFIMGKDKNLCV